MGSSATICLFILDKMLQISLQLFHGMAMPGVVFLRAGYSFSHGRTDSEAIPPFHDRCGRVSWHEDPEELSRLLFG
jgi:hypothetical protein